MLIHLGGTKNITQTDRSAYEGLLRDIVSVESYQSSDEDDKRWKRKTISRRLAKTWRKNEGVTARRVFVGRGTTADFDFLNNKVSKEIPKGP